MTTKLSTLLVALVLLGTSFVAKAGNPDRQGEAGAYELLLNPWARSAGLNGLVAANVEGVESMRFNPAGLARFRSTEIYVANTQYLVGTGINLNAVGLAQSVGDNGTFGLSLMAMSFGDIPLTTTAQPEGIGTFSPNFFHIGLSYGHLFKDEDGNEKVSVGVTARAISEAIADATATGICFDAGVQYTTGAKRQIKIGLALRNIGTKMSFNGDGMTFVGVAPDGETPLAVEQRVAGFEMPSLLHIGLAYDFELNETNRLTMVGNFTANSFSRDQYGIGAEYAFREIFMVRAGYRYEPNMYGESPETLRAGITGGVTIDVPLARNSKNRLGFDYAYEATTVFGGTHSLGLRLTL